MKWDELIKRYPPAKLALADGSIFKGHSIGAEGKTVGEVVFNTSMTGYQEILTDPSYCQQIVTLTNPHIGNVGVNSRDSESTKIQAAGLVIRDLSLTASNWRSTDSLVNYLTKNSIIAIAGIDTRRLTRLLRNKGAQKGCIVTGEMHDSRAIEHANHFPGLTGMDLAKTVSTKERLQWTQGTYDLKSQRANLSADAVYHVVVYDFGVKSQILRLLVDRGCRVTLVPAQTGAQAVLDLKPDGILLSNGPGDPAACDYAIKNIQTLVKADIPIFGICLGFQLLALALNAKTRKMKFGHHGANHPIQNGDNHAVAITSQNHGFVVDDARLPADLCVTHRSLFDGTLQGLRHRTKPIFALQGHPEASPGPQDIVSLFDSFIEMIRERTKHHAKT